MTAESSESTNRPAATERQQAIWPWLLVPLIALALFFTLRSFRNDGVEPPSDDAAETSAGAELHQGAL